MMLRRNARKALESQIANISARISVSHENRVSGQLLSQGVEASQLVNNTTRKKMTFWFLCLLTIMEKVPT
jgi:hypothetical protein